MILEQAKQQYRDSWEEYRTNFDEERKQELEKLMDQAQDHFTNEQFQEFKITLPGFCEYWGFLNDIGQEAIRSYRERQTSS